MRISIYAGLLIVLTVPLLLPRAVRRLAPRPAAFVHAGVATFCGLAWLIGLGTLAAATVGRLSVAGWLGHWSSEALNATDPVPIGVGVVAVVLLAITLLSLALESGRLVAGMLDMRRLRAAAWGLDRIHDVVIVNSRTPEALALPGWRGVVLVTSAMIEALDPDDYEVLLAHERCHLRARHWVFRVTVRLGAALVPSARRLILPCNRALERWADETAAVAVGGRRRVAMTLAKAALATPYRGRREVAPAFSEGTITARVKALLNPLPEVRWGGLLLLAVLLSAGTIALVEALRDFEALIGVARHVLR